MKLLSKAVLIFYLLFLLWLVLFKFSFDPLSVLGNQTGSLSLVPFAGNDLREMIDNFVVFVPFGLLLGVNFKRTALWQKLVLVFSVSLMAEFTQFVLAIGAADITDVIMNTLGGFIGLVLYDFGKKYVHDKKLDLSIVLVSAVLLVIFILLRIMVFKVRY